MMCELVYWFKPEIRQFRSERNGRILFKDASNS